MSGWISGGVNFFQRSRLARPGLTPPGACGAVCIMHFTIERARLLALARVARIGAIGPRRRECKVFLWACAARVFLQVNGTVAGEEALVLRDGGCLVRLTDLLSLAKLYPRRTNFTVEADANVLRIAKVPVRCAMPVGGRHDLNRV